MSELGSKGTFYVFSITFRHASIVVIPEAVAVAPVFSIVVPAIRVEGTPGAGTRSVPTAIHGLACRKAAQDCDDANKERECDSHLSFPLFLKDVDLEIKLISDFK